MMEVNSITNNQPSESINLNLREGIRVYNQQTTNKAQLKGKSQVKTTIATQNLEVSL